MSKCNFMIIDMKTIVVRSFHNDVKSRNVLSKVLKPVNEISVSQTIEKGLVPKKYEEISSKSSRMLLDYGFIKQSYPGAFTYLPFAQRSIKKLENLIDSHLSEIGCQKILLPTMTEGELWKKSGRWKLIQEELFKLKNRHHKDFVLGPTFEESITSLMANLGTAPLKSLPLKLYQISTKFRDEMRPKFGLIRSKEFIMKDLYTFDKVKKNNASFIIIPNCYVGVHCFRTSNQLKKHIKKFKTATTKFSELWSFHMFVFKVTLEQLVAQSLMSTILSVILVKMT